MKMILNAHADHYLGDSWPMSQSDSFRLLITESVSLQCWPPFPMWVSRACLFSLGKASEIFQPYTYIAMHLLLFCCKAFTEWFSRIFSYSIRLWKGEFHLSWVLQICPFPLEFSCNTSRHVFSRTWCGRCLSTKLWGQILSCHRSQPRCSAHGLSVILPIRICNIFLDSIYGSFRCNCDDGKDSDLERRCSMITPPHSLPFHFLSFQEQPLLYCIHSYDI